MKYLDKIAEFVGATTQEQKKAFEEGYNKGLLQGLIVGTIILIVISIGTVLTICFSTSRILS